MTYHVAVDDGVAEAVGHAHPVDGDDGADVGGAGEGRLAGGRVHEEPVEGGAPEDAQQLEEMGRAPADGEEDADGDEHLDRFDLRL